MWSDPSNSLEARATFERSVAAQIVIRVLTAVDPSFIEYVSYYMLLLKVF